MSILGIESAVFGVDDLAECIRFWDDFGLTLQMQDEQGAEFGLPSGSRVIVRGRHDTGVADWFDYPGVKEVIWGVDSEASLEALVADLSSDRVVRRDPDGTAHTIADDGIPFGLRVWAKHPVVSQPDAVNAPGCIQRLNQHRKWRRRAIPKTINHVVFFSNDYVRSLEFYRDRLGFRYTDHSENVGAFARADGTNEHHSIFWVNTDLPVSPDEPGFMHIAFGLEDIDELMIGMNRMQQRGWKNNSMNSASGLSRHRISSAMYAYVENPNGGEAEYLVDTDYLDDNWVPRAWEFRFGALMWAHNLPAMFQGITDWDMRFDADSRSLEPFRKGVHILSNAAAEMQADDHAV